MRRGWVYILTSKSGTLYIGVTGNLFRRVLEHKDKDIPGLTSKYGCGRLVLSEEFEDISQAIGREKQLKGWRRSKKIALIESVNPEWKDLAEHWGWQMLFPGERIDQS